MSACIVTCLYHGLEGTKYGGRNRYTMYAESLLSIDNAGVPIYCYVFEKDHNALTEYFARNSAKNIHVISHDILSEDYHDDIMSIKDANPLIYYGDDLFWKTRCPDIMYGKHRLMKKTIEAHPEYTHIFWIDAGLSNSSVMRHKFFPKINQHQHHESEGIFTNRFMSNMIEFSDNKILALLHTHPNNFRIPEKYNKSPYVSGNYSMIAGLFGGRVEHITWFSAEIEIYIKNILNDKILFSEESIYTGIVNDNRDRFAPLLFDTFYNEDWGDTYSPGQISFASIIDKFI